MNENDRIIVRIWLPRVDKQKSSALDVVKARCVDSEREVSIGHSSLEIVRTEKYISLWPNTSSSNTGSLAGICTPINPSYHTALTEDIEAENREPDVIVCLYSLKIGNITSIFDEIHKSSSGYKLIGDSSIGSGEGHSCCSLVYSLLQFGGIEELSASEGSTLHSVVVTPANFAEFIKDAKRKELEKYPETREYPRIGNEYLPEPIAKGWCNML